MLLPSRTTVGALALILFAPLATPVAMSQEPVPRDPAPARPVSLHCGVPEDAHFMVHGLDSPTPDPSWLALERFVSELSHGDFHRDLFQLIALGQPAWRRQAFLDSTDEWLGLLGKVDWSGLVATEVAFAYRLAAPMPEYVYLFRVPEAAAAQADALGTLLAQLAEQGDFGEDAVKTRELDDGRGRLTILTLPGAPVQFLVGHADDVVILSTSARLGRWSATHLLSGDTTSTLAAHPRFNDSLAHLPTANEAIFYVDLAGIFEFAGPLLQLAGSAIPQDDSAEGQGIAMLLDIAGVVMDDLGDQLDHLVSVTVSDGERVTTTNLLRQPDGAEFGALAELARDRQPWSEWQQLVPPDALSYAFEPGADPVALIHYVQNLLALRAIDADRPLPAAIDAISGEFGWIELPAGAGGCPFGETILMLRLDDPQAIAPHTGDLLQHAAGFLRGRDQQARVEELDGALQGGHVLHLGAAPWLRPTIAIRDDLLVIASTPEALARMTHGGTPPAATTRMGPHGAFGRYNVERPTFGFGDLLGMAGLTMAMLPDEIRQEPAIPIVNRMVTTLAAAVRHLELGYEVTWHGLPSPGEGLELSTMTYRYR